MILNSFSSISRSLSGSIVIVAGSIKDALESIQLCWLGLLLLCTLIVAVGVVAEEWVEHASGNDRWAVAPEWHKQLARIGWILVILGVVGEGVFEAGIFFADRNLQEYNDTLLLNAEAMTGNAAKSAETAAKAAHEAQNSADVAGAVADNAKKKAGEATAAAAKALDLSMNATETAEHLRVDLEKAKDEEAILRKHLDEVAEMQQPRWMTFNTDKFINVLKGIPKHKVLIWYQPEDSEAYHLALKFASAVGTESPTSLGWEVTIEPAPPGVSPNPALSNAPLADRFGALGAGIALGVKSVPLPSDRPDDPVLLFVEAIRQAGLGVWVHGDHHLPEDKFWLVIAQQQE